MLFHFSPLACACGYRMAHCEGLKSVFNFSQKTRTICSALGQSAPKYEIHRKSSQVCFSGRLSTKHPIKFVSSSLTSSGTHSLFVNAVLGSLHNIKITVDKCRVKWFLSAHCFALDVDWPLWPSVWHHYSLSQSTHTLHTQLKIFG